MFNAHCTAGSATTYSLRGCPPLVEHRFRPVDHFAQHALNGPVGHALLGTENRCSTPSAYASLRATRLRKWVALSLTHVVGGPNVAHQWTSSSTVPFAVHAVDGCSHVYQLTSAIMTSTY